MTELITLLSRIEAGDSQAAAQLLPLVYDRLRRLAAAKLAQEKPGQTLQPTALVHEAYLRLVGNGRREQAWDSQAHFFAAAAEAMRRILIDQARQKKSLRRGGGRQRRDASQVDVVARQSKVDILEINEALERFEQLHPEKAQLVKLRYFAGLSIPQVAHILGVSTTTVDRHWAYARAWLHAELSRQQ